MILDNSDLSAAIAPKLVAALQARKQAIAASAGGPVRETAVLIAWPLLIREMPHLADAAVEAVRSEFGAMTLNDLLDWLGKQS